MATALRCESFGTGSRPRELDRRLEGQHPADHLDAEEQQIRPADVRAAVGVDLVELAVVVELLDVTPLDAVLPLVAAEPKEAVEPAAKATRAVRGQEFEEVEVVIGLKAVAV